ncbi:hypothetical protein V6N13_051172 [Hibiscus sabdariffa]
MIDSASGRALFNTTPTQARELISTMAANSQQFGVISEPNRRAHEVNTVSIENKINQLTNIVNSLITGTINPARACGICTMTDHPTDCCSNLLEETVNAIGNFPGSPQRPYNPHGNTYNLGWHDHLNLSYAPNQRLNPTYQPRPPQQYQPPNKPSLETLMERSGTVIKPPIQEEKKAPKSTSCDFPKEDDVATQKENFVPEPEPSPYAAQPPSH